MYNSLKFVSLITTALVMSLGSAVYGQTPPLTPLRVRGGELLPQQKVGWSSVVAQNPSSEAEGLYELMIELLQHLLSIAREAKDKSQEASFLAVMGDVYNNQKQYDRALEFYQQALPVAREVKDKSLEARIIALIGYVYFNQKQYDRALEFYQQALPVAREAKDKSREALIIAAIGDVYNNQKQYDRALEFYQQALPVAREAKDKSLETLIIALIGYAYFNQKQYDRALEFYQQALPVAREAKDKSLEALSLAGIGDFYKNQGKYSRAIEIYEQVLMIQREIKDNLGEIQVLSAVSGAYFLVGNYNKAIDLGIQSVEKARQINNPQSQAQAMSVLKYLYVGLGEFDKALNLEQQRLNIARAIKDSQLEADVLLGLAEIYWYKGEFQQQIDLAEQALKIARKIPDLNLEAKSFVSLSLGYTFLGNYPKAMELAQMSINIAKQSKDPDLEWQTLQNLGSIYDRLGNYQKSIELYQQYLVEARQRKQPLFEALGLTMLGYSSFFQGDAQKTVELTEQALVIFQNNKFPFVEYYGFLVNSIGYGQLGNYEKALASAQKALEFAKKTQSPYWKKISLNLLGGIYRRFGKTQEAIATYQQALAINIPGQGTGIDSDNGTYAGLAQIYRDLNQPETAIKYYRQAIDGIEQLRRNNQGLPSELQNSFLSSNIIDFDQRTPSNIYREYADLLLKQGRTLEAQAVLELLKFQEIKDFFRTRGTATATNNTVIALGKELTELENIPPEQRTPTQQQRAIELRKILEQTIKEFGAFIQTPEVAKRIEELRQITQGQNLDVEYAKTLQDNLKRLQQDAVILYPLVLPDRLELVLVTPYAPPIRRTVPVTQPELNSTIEAFRRDLESPISNAQSNANQLYEWLIKPIEKDLETAKTKTIIFAPDGQLRYIPLAALHDGKQWLLQRFRINNITGLSLTEFNTKPQEKLRVLSAAFANINRSVPVKLGQENVTFRGLTFAGKEVENIAASIPGTTKLVDDKFNQDIVYQMNDYSIVHLATHAAFVDGAPDDSIIMFGNGTYATLPNVKDWRLPNVDLVVLSACQTGLGGFGDGKEILGFGYRMQTTGAKATIATLWSVDDGGTQALMDAFYAALQQPNTTKAEALRQAQVALITGNYQALGQQRGIAVRERIRNGLPTKVQSRLSHPYYWAPFILIGNGL